MSKHYGTVSALDDLSLSIEPGTIQGLLGPNGAGKTTLIRILATLLAPDESSGRIEVAGLDVVKESAKVRAKIGLAGQFAAVDEFLTGRETLEMVGALYHLPRTEARKRSDELLERLSLTDAADRPAKTYSGGMRRRLDLGASLIVHPPVIFLDEPTTGLDPRTRLELWDIIRDLARDGSTILLTTQYLEEADALANTIAVIDHGHLVAEGTPAELKNSLGRDIVELQLKPGDKVKGLTILRALGGDSVMKDELTGAIRLPAIRGSNTLLDVANALAKKSIEPLELSLHRPSLDDVFLAVTGKRVSASGTDEGEGGAQ